MCLSHVWMCGYVSCMNKHVCVYSWDLWIRTWCAHASISMQDECVFFVQMHACMHMINVLHTGTLSSTRTLKRRTRRPSRRQRMSWSSTSETGVTAVGSDGCHKTQLWGHGCHLGQQGWGQQGRATPHRSTPNTRGVFGGRQMTRGCVPGMETAECWCV